MKSLAFGLTVALLYAAPVSFTSIDSAQARVGRPLTPMSVAGVHRRVHRRAAVGVGLGAAAVGVGIAHHRCMYWYGGHCGRWY